MRREYPKKYGIVSFAPYVGISQQVQRVRFCLLNYKVVPLLFDFKPYLCVCMDVSNRLPDLALLNYHIPFTQGRSVIVPASGTLPALCLDNR